LAGLFLSASIAVVDRFGFRWYTPVILNLLLMTTFSLAYGKNCLSE